MDRVLPQERRGRDVDAGRSGRSSLSARSGAIPHGRTVSVADRRTVSVADRCTGARAHRCTDQRAEPVAGSDLDGRSRTVPNGYGPPRPLPLTDSLANGDVDTDSGAYADANPYP